MKNIHLLPTDKPSRLWKNNLLQGKLELSKEILIGSNTAQNIYITSDEEIKESDYVYSTSQDFNIQKVSKGLEAVYNDTEHYSKIILTTDQDLINDGIQAIPDEFLEWFVNNSSCEEVEVELLEYGFDEVPICKYEIIIPKEIQKQHLIDMMKADEEIGLYEELKQEILEKAAEKFYPPKTTDLICSPKLVRDSFMAGAKWQQEPEQFFNDDRAKTLEKSIEYLLKKQERMYSEEEVLRIITECKSYLSFGDEFDEIKWFEQFKKK